MLFEDFNNDYFSQLIYPLFDLYKYEIYSMICIFVWYYPNI